MQYTHSMTPIMTKVCRLGKEVFRNIFYIEELIILQLTISPDDNSFLHSKSNDKVPKHSQIKAEKGGWWK